MTLLYCLQNRKIFGLLFLWIKDVKAPVFCWKLKKDNSFSRSNIKICRDKFISKKYFQRTYFQSNVYTNFCSVIALKQNFALVCTFLHSCFIIVSDFLKFHFSAETLKKHFAKMLTQRNFLPNAVESFLMTYLFKDLLLLQFQI